MRSGVILKGLPKARKCWGSPTPDENGKGVHAVAAADLADYLAKKPFVGCPAPVEVKPDTFYDFISDKKGIIYFENYWQRNNDSEGNRTGDHIDLWDGSVLASNGYAWSNFREILPSTAEYFGMSDLSKSSKILFWEFL